MRARMFSSFNPTGFAIDAADFDGTNDSMARGAALTGSPTSTKTCIFSCWLRLDGGNAVNLVILDGAAQGGTSRLANNKLHIAFGGASATVQLDTVNTYVASATWLHFLSSFDVATVGASHLYINDVSDKVETVFTNVAINFNSANWITGAANGLTFKFNGCLADIYFAPGQFLDFSVTANRRKFISATGKPVNLGSDGSTPTGTAPLVLHHLTDGETVANFALNRGTGGNFTITGSLDPASTSPSD